MLKRIFVFLLLLAWCCAIVGVRVWKANSFLFFFLLWNLFLAAVPYAASLACETLDRYWRVRPLQWVTLVVWLLFLPNAPYIVTDFIHLKARPPIPIWYDVLMLLSCAGTGLLLGYASVMTVHRLVTKHYGVFAGWATALLALFLSAFGIYLGRFLRWNSWEVVTEPMPLFREIATQLMNPMDYPRTFIVTGLFGIALCLGYIALDVVMESEAERRQMSQREDV